MREQVGGMKDFLCRQIPIYKARLWRIMIARLRDDDLCRNVYVNQAYYQNKLRERSK